LLARWQVEIVLPEERLNVDTFERGPTRLDEPAHDPNPGEECGAIVAQSQVHHPLSNAFLEFVTAVEPQPKPQRAGKVSELVVRNGKVVLPALASLADALAAAPLDR
jgi:hypothetical protein